ncbi:MAG: hypothetical protein V4574_09375 [Pseudomonadota bacterium]
MKPWKPWTAPLAAAILLPLMLASCLFMPGKFESSLTIHKDRSFTFTYKGEVVALDLDDPGKGITEASSEPADMMAENATEADDSIYENTTEEIPAETAEQRAEASAKRQAEKDEQYREVAAQLAKEAGYRTVEYRGNGVFYVDYAISGVLTHNFTYPYNLDSAMVFPWVSVELRGKDAVRVKATGFAKQDLSSLGPLGMGGGAPPGGSAPPSKVNGTFTLITDAGVVSQNNEEGAETVGADTVITWRVTPKTPDAPMAVLRVKPIP